MTCPVDTSKHPPQPNCHGKRGEFLASLAALSLLSIASHHRDYRSHNALVVHNSKLVSRNLPAWPQQRVLAFAGGTRVSVTALFGSMPVRVKHRAMEVERAGTARDFDQLVFQVVAYLLAWPGEATVSVEDLHSHRAVSLKTAQVVDWAQGYRDAAPALLSRAVALLSQATLLENDDPKTWVPIGATATGVSVRGCVCLRPVATKGVQFIALGIQPLLNEHQSNVFYQDVNQVFEDSSFGVIEEVDVDEHGNLVKTQGFTGKELNPKRGIDRWPMFFLQIVLDPGTGSVDMEKFLDERHQNVAIISDLLQVMAYEFLKKHHFRPRSVTAMDRLKPPKSGSSARTSPARKIASSVTPSGQPNPVSKQAQAKYKPSTRISPSPRRSGRIEKRVASPFASWSKTKSSASKDPGAKDTALPSQHTPTSAPCTPSSSGGLRSWWNPPVALTTLPSSGNPFFDKSGTLIRKPFEDADEAPAASASGVPAASDEPSTDTGTERETLVWVDPVTKIKSLIDSRTGFAVKPRGVGLRNAMHLPKHGGGRENFTRPLSREPSGGVTQNTIFQPTESRIPQIAQASETLGCGHRGLDRDCLNDAPGTGNMLATLESRISKPALLRAEIISQVDQKFILAKVDSGPSPSQATDPSQTLILIDQHAADERCKVEALLQSYFTPDPTNPAHLLAQTETLTKPLRFDLSKQDGNLLARFQNHFTHWGISYSFPADEIPAPQNGVTIEVHLLPPAIAERCRLEPRLLADLFRKEIWKLHASGSSGSRTTLHTNAEVDWPARFHDCPDGVLELINSRACRSKCSLRRDADVGEEKLTRRRRNHVQRPVDSRGVCRADEEVGGVCVSVSVCAWAAVDGAACSSWG